MKRYFLLFALSLFLFSHVQAQKTDTLSITLDNVKYPYPVRYFPISTEGQDIKMAYMDVAPTAAANGKNSNPFPWEKFWRLLLG
jgi:hypothetical protein